MKLRNQAMALILAEMFLIITSAFWERELEGGYWLSSIYFVFFTLGGYALAQDRGWLYRYIILCLISLSLGVMGNAYWSQFSACVCSTLAYLMIFKVLIKHSFFRKKVPKSDRVLSGIAGYILLGLFWSGIFMFIGRQHPGAILNQVSGEPTLASENLYYSFVTITSLGYGDIVPVNPSAKIVAIFAGLSGVLFTAIFIAALVGSVMLQDTKESSRS
ncbi:potassium channel family protein [Rubritalea sp.]|uniref:potassium channel family protein n=1 Tax=Rubritalea sp. TaxID=2109375 RepID=UPI003241C97C